MEDVHFLTRSMAALQNGSFGSSWRKLRSGYT